MTRARRRPWAASAPVAGLSLASLLAGYAPLGAAAPGPGGAAPAEATLASAPDRAMSLEQALAYEREHQPALLTALARVRALRAEAAVPRAARLPVVTVAAELVAATTNNTTATVLPPSILDLPRIGATPVERAGDAGWTPAPSTLAALGVRQELFDFGRIAAAATVADLSVEVEERRAQSERMRIDLAVRDAFYAVRSAHAVLAVADEAYARAHAHRTMIAAAIANGLRPAADLARAEADQAHFDVARTRARGALVSAQAVFAAAVGFESGLLDAVGEPPPPPPLPTLPSALQRATERNPIVLEAWSRLRRQQAVTLSLGTLTRPDLSLSGTLSGRAGGARPSTGPVPGGGGWIPDVPNWDGGLVLRWPLFEPMARAREDAAREAEEVARAATSLAWQEQAAAIRQAHVEVETASLALAGLERAREAARTNYEQAEARYTRGVGTALELADAESLRTEAEVALAIGQYDVARARALLDGLIAADG